jgi:hypothetical protein
MTARPRLIEGESGELSIEDLIAEEDMAITGDEHRLHQAAPAISTYRISGVAARAASA